MHPSTLMLLLLLLLLVVDPVCGGANVSRVDGRGFGEQFEWFSFEGGLKEAEARAKPAMILIHKSWCGACRALKPVVSGSTSIEQLAKEFVMINVEDQEEPTDAAWHVDGSYIPRIYFYDGEHGELLTEIECEGGNAKYKYFHSSEETIVKSMRKALAVVGKRKEQEEAMLTILNVKENSEGQASKEEL